MERKRKLICTVGLPMSGRSEWAIAQGHPVVSPDSVRVSMCGVGVISSAESMVWTLIHYFILSLFDAGHEVVILNAGNMTERVRGKWEIFGSRHNVEVEFHVVRTPARICIERAEAKGHTHLIEAIKRLDAVRDWMDEDELEREKGMIDKINENARQRAVQRMSIAKKYTPEELRARKRFELPAEGSSDKNGQPAGVLGEKLQAAFETKDGMKDESCSSCKARIKPTAVRYAPGDGRILCPRCGELWESQKHEISR